MDTLDLKRQAVTDIEILFGDEIDYLKAVLEMLAEAFEKTTISVNRHHQEYQESKRYIAEYRHEIDPKEIFQNELALKDIERSGMIAVGARERLSKLLESPYFGRIDFLERGGMAAETYYIGRFTFAKDAQIIIFDWRAPIAGMFYEYELGQAGYDAPIGRIEGTLTKKRQYKVANGQLKYVLESAMNIHDEVLQRELSNTSDEKMKTIIATLQQEQNRIIRNEQAQTLIIQGVAGSGKTSVALHRVAYLLYHYKDTLSAKNIVILSPNKVFGDYISNVLPELGEEPIYQMSFSDIAEIQLEGVIDFEFDVNPLEEPDTAWTERADFKSMPEFVIMLDNYIDEIANSIFEPVDYSAGQLGVTAEWIWRRYEAYRNYSVKRRLVEIADDIYEKFVAENVMEAELPRKTTILKKLNDMLKVKNTLLLYQGFYQSIQRPELFVMTKKNTLEWIDVYPFLYVHAFYMGLKENQVIKHLVIDEMQDYTLMQYEVINLLFKCKKTILGDFAQQINPYNQNSLEDMAVLYATAEVIRLNKSYRSSYEIINFARKVLNVDDLEAVERHGEAVAIIACQDKLSEIQKIKELIAVFAKSDNVTMGIITKSNQESIDLYRWLEKNQGIRLITPESNGFTSGITIVSVQMSKGLEFDEVVIPFANASAYKNESDRKLLYVACTRGMHKLTLLYSGERSKLID